MTFGSWIEPYSDHVTMSCRASAAGASIVDALVASRGDAAYFGRRLPREVALTRPRLREMWELVDAVLTTVPEAAAQVYHERRA